jgi:hypothetical protein
MPHRGGSEGTPGQTTSVAGQCSDAEDVCLRPHDVGHGRGAAMSPPAPIDVDGEPVNVSTSGGFFAIFTVPLPKFMVQDRARRRRIRKELEPESRWPNQPESRGSISRLPLQRLVGKRFVSSGIRPKALSHKMLGFAFASIRSRQARCPKAGSAPTAGRSFGPCLFFALSTTFPLLRRPVSRRICCFLPRMR